jgi:capsular polysaccharide biosynthesis protein
MEKEVEVIDYLRAIWRRRFLILFGTVFLVGLVAIFNFFSSPIYEASTQVKIGRVWDKEIENPYLTTEIVASDSFLFKVIESLNLPLTPLSLKEGKFLEVKLFEGGISPERLPQLLLIKARFSNPQKAVDFANAVSLLLVEMHQTRFEEKLNEYKNYENQLARDVGRIETQISNLEKMIKMEQLKPSVSAPSIILLEAQLEQKTAQSLEFKRELNETRVNNNSSIITEKTRVVAPPVLPKDPVNTPLSVKMIFSGLFGILSFILLSLFLEYLIRIKKREQAEFQNGKK